MLLMSKLRHAARDAARLAFTYGGGDASELVALVRQIADRERCTIDYRIEPSEPGVFTVQFVRQTVASR